jgi:outer membrane protein OmpA-like peptidoglycan-associated protein
MGEVSTQKVKNIAKLLLKNYTTHVKIIGYSDTVETSKYNESLSILRGEVLKIALINLGIEEYRLTSYIGTNTKEQLEEIRKIVKNQKEWLAVNRRVEIEISYPND